MSRVSSARERIKANTEVDGDHNSNWAISYGDMITLLLAFFVLFFNLDSDSYKMKLVESQLVEAFNGFKEPPNRKPDMVWGNTNKLDQHEPMFDRKMDEIPEIETKLQGDKLLIEFPGISFFETAQYSLTPKGDQILQKFAEIFRPYLKDMRIIVRGYTDNRRVKWRKGLSFRDNLELSSYRSLSAIRSLSKKGIPLHLMRIGGYGETDKAKAISKKEALKYDRKIVLVVEPLDSTERNFPKIFRKTDKISKEVKSDS